MKLTLTFNPVSGDVSLRVSTAWSAILLGESKASDATRQTRAKVPGGFDRKSLESLHSESKVSQLFRDYSRFLLDRRKR